MFVNAGLRTLLRLKLKGALRKQLVRLRTPRGLLFALLGIALFAAWLGGSLMISTNGPRPVLADELRLPMAQLAFTIMTLLTAASALTHRGLYLPADEIERLFSAPLSRRDLIRYRLLVNSGRSLLGATILGLFASRWAAEPLYGFVGTFVATLTLPIVGQALSILAGDAENRLLEHFPRRAFRYLALAAALSIWVFIMALFFGARDLTAVLAEFGIDGDLASILGHPLVAALTSPVLPWAQMVMAPSAAAFLPWAGLCSLLWIAFFELTTLLPVDFRQLSLETSADVARRLNRARRGGLGASASTASQRLAGWRLPFVFGRGPIGAVAWRKTLGIVRKARGTALTSLAIVLFLTVLTALMGNGETREEILAGNAILLCMGTLYLCGGLRFDFRDELEHMEVLKAWPVRPWQVFLATLLPQVLLVSVLMAGALALRALLTQTFDPLVLGLVALLPFVAGTWMALDNIVFLLFPVRYLPGTDGTLQHTGRLVIVLCLRMALLVFVGLAIGAAVAVVLLFSDMFAWPAQQTWLAAALAGSALLVCVMGLLVAAGGRALARFDVARDRG